MKKTTLLVIFLSLFATTSAYSDSCEPCKKAIDLEKKIASSKIIPDQMNAKTIPQQDEFIDQGSTAIKNLLKEKDFNKDHAKALLKLLSRIACFYDNQGDIAFENKEAFKKIYDKKGNPIIEQLSKMKKSGEITEKRSLAMLEAIGAIPAADHISAGCRDYK